MTLVMKKFTTCVSWKPKPNQKPRFFLQNLPKPNDRKHFETVTTLKGSTGSLPRWWLQRTINKYPCCQHVEHCIDWNFCCTHSYGLSYHRNHFLALFPGPPGWAGARIEVLDLMVQGKGRLTKADPETLRLGATPSGLTSAHLHHPPIFLQAGCPSCRPTNSVKAPKAAVGVSVKIGLRVGVHV